MPPVASARSPIARVIPSLSRHPPAQGVRHLQLHQRACIVGHPAIRRRSSLSLAASMQTATLAYHEADTTLEGFYAWQGDQSPRPGVLVAHTAIGPQEDFIRDKCRLLAELGYVGFSLDVFGAGHCVFGEEKDAVNELLCSDRDLGQHRVLVGLEAMAALPMVDASRVGAIGYCLGGKLVLDLARAGRPEVKAVVSFHGILDSVKLAVEGPMTASVLCYHGGRDPFVPDASLLAFKQQMDAKGADYEVVVLGQCRHAFTRPDKTTEQDAAAGFLYDERAAVRSWRGAAALLEEQLL